MRRDPFDLGEQLTPAERVEQRYQRELEELRKRLLAEGQALETGFVPHDADRLGWLVRAVLWLLEDAER